jgi:hypothetical protein
LKNVNKFCGSKVPVKAYLITFKGAEELKDSELAYYDKDKDIL